VSEREPLTQTMKASDARQNFSQVLNQVFRRETRVLVEKSGIPVAAIVSAADLDRLTRIDEQRKRDFAVLDEMRDAFRNEKTEDIEREITRAIREVRAGRSVAGHSDELR
jgi:prevent-host-death family protein